MGVLFGITYAILVAFGKNFLKKSFDSTSSSAGFFFETLASALFGFPLRYLQALISTKLQKSYLLSLLVQYFQKPIYFTFTLKAKLA